MVFQNVSSGATVRSSMVAVLKYNDIFKILAFEILWKVGEVFSTIVAPAGGIKWLCFAEHCGTEEKQIKP